MEKWRMFWESEGAGLIWAIVFSVLVDVLTVMLVLEAVCSIGGVE